MIKPLTDIEQKLFAAIYYHDIDGVCAALANGASPNARKVMERTMFCTPIGYAFMRDNFSAASILLQHPDHDINQTAHMNDPILHWVAHTGQLDLVKTCIEHGADVNLRAESGAIPLTYAIAHYHKHVIIFLLENGANPNALEDNPDYAKGRTIMHMAALQGYLGLMIRYGGNPLIPDDNGITPLDLAKKRAQNIMACKKYAPKP